MRDRKRLPVGKNDGRHVDSYLGDYDSLAGDKLSNTGALRVKHRGAPEAKVFKIERNGLKSLRISSIEVLDSCSSV